MKQRHIESSNRQNAKEIKLNRLHPDDMGTGFVMYDLGEAIGKYKEYATEPQRYDFYQIAWVSSGNGTTRVDGQEYAYESGIVFMGLPGQVINIVEEAGTRGKLVCFDERLLMDGTRQVNIGLKYGTLNAVYAAPCYKLEEKERQAMSSLMEMLQAVSEEPVETLEHRHALQYLVGLILIVVLRAMPKHGKEAMRPSNYRNTVCVQYCNLIEEHYKDGWHTWKYAQELGISERRLASAVQESVGKSPRELIWEKVLNEACLQLIYTDAPISAIAMGVGMMDSSNFNKFFKLHMGISPAEYREKEAKKSQSDREE